MKMEFIFDENKMKENGYTKQECLKPIRLYFEDQQRDTIKEIKEGVFEGTDDDWSVFASAAIFPYTNWFLDVIKEWYWYVDEGDGKGIQKEDCLKAYYDVVAVNGR